MQHLMTPSGRATGSRWPRRQIGAFLAIPLALLVFVAACGSDDSDTPATGDTGANADVLGPVHRAAGEPVKIGIISDGKSAAVDNSVQFDVAAATAKWLNERKGGIGGRPIELVKCETQSDPGKGADCGNQMIEADVVAVAIAESSVAESVARPLADANIPAMFFGVGNPSILQDTESMYTLGDPTYTTLQLPINLAKEQGTDKVASVVIDVPAALDQQKIAPGVYADAGLGYQLVTVPPGTADMTPQMQRIVDGKAGLVFVVGNDSFCISAFNGLKAVGYDGTVSAISQCITDATRKAVPADVLRGMVVAAVTPAGGNDPTSVLFTTVMKAYGKDIDLTATSPRTMFITLSGLQTALEGISGDITPATVNATIKAMPEKALPGAAGLRFRCNGKAVAGSPAACVRGGLSTTLDTQGKPTTYQVLGYSPITD
ncbi:MULTISPECIES: ABC transporter substrate-binding protein [unclassified Pseudofrankia]|uniref:ABC transporter substrate-binding protein n=1 Tax=unclassified Pseudofrankia TaxID=2994372 RepID=UPI0008D8E369|nr:MULTISPECIES: ABC transporter substrate-binding protein [unclassified Pseudofrankia]MDT3442915.1 ABC transporter substrate-binding protein [Pseudofrankia sp. BMG5.37]OHV62868.1 branched-chain amino acid ABC transporter substrate-binding protein [Pseudofrankia sp. BMG5.36]